MTIPALRAIALWGACSGEAVFVRNEMDKFVLSLKMKQLTAWLDGRCQPKTLARRQFEGAPFGSCYVTIDPSRQAAFASANMNRVYLCGMEPGMESGSINRLIELFAAAGVKRFFV